jgi:hypothetical protein
MTPTRSTHDPSVALRQAEADAERAREALTHPGLRDAFARLDKHYAAIMRRSTPSEGEQREAAYLMLRALDALATDITSAINEPALLKHNYRSVLRTVGDNE